MTNKTETELLPVTQEDREAAADYAEACMEKEGMAPSRAKFISNPLRAGKADKDLLTQAFARHRMNTRPTQDHDALVEAIKAGLDGLIGITDLDDAVDGIIANLPIPQAEEEMAWAGRLDRVTAELDRIAQDHERFGKKPALDREIAERAIHEIYGLYECRADSTASGYSWTSLQNILGLYAPTIPATPQAEAALRSAAPTSLQNMQTSPDGLVDELRAKLEAIQGPKKGEDEHPEWLSTLLNICRDIEDEGDRVYFGSTNDADDLRDVVNALEKAHHPLHLFRRPDLHRYNAELRKLNEAQAARIAELADENTALRSRPSGDGEGE